MVDKSVFREFCNEEEVEIWAKNNFGQWINDIKDYKPFLEEDTKYDDVGKLLYYYSGYMNRDYNDFLRGVGVYQTDETKKYMRDIAIMIEAINKFELEESIVVYR